MASSASGRDRRRGAAARPSLIALVALLGVGTLVASAPAATVNFAATLDESQESTPTGSPGTGTGTFVMDTEANTLTIDITYSGLLGTVSMGHIHGYAGPGMDAGIVYGFLDPNSPISEVWNYPEGNEAQIIAGLTYANIHTSSFPGGEIRGQVLRVPACGDTVVDGGEDCDDGNLTNGDCCDSACQFEANGSDCSTGLCTSGLCDGAGECVGALRTGCLAAGKSGLSIKNNADDDGKDKLGWKWTKGQATAIEDFGVPTGTTAFALCVYAGASTTPIGQVDIPGSAFWSAAGDSGWKYKDGNGSADGVQKAKFKAGADGKSKAQIKGAGTNLPDFPAGPLTLPITVQLVNSTNDVCLESVFPNATKNEAEQFKAKAP